MMEMLISICAFFILFVPGFQKTYMGEKGYYVIHVNGEEIGAAGNAEIAEEAYLAARARVAGESSDLVFIDCSHTITEENRIIGSTQEKEELEDGIYAALKNSVIEAKKKAYTVKIDEFSVTVSSKDEVIQLLETSKSKYDADNEFTIELIEDASKELGIMTTSFINLELSAKVADTVASAMTEAGETTNPDAATEEVVQAAEVSEEMVQAAEEQGEISLGIQEIDFEEAVEVMETYVTGEDIVSVEEAIDMVTKEKETNKIYEVVAGDCLSIVAEKNGINLQKIVDMNEMLTEESVIQIGDEIVVTVPEPELSVMVQENDRYEEDYEAEVQYIENDSWYTTQEVVRQEPVTGHRQVVAAITYRNGKEVERTIIEENIMAQAVPKIIEVGTLTPPTYIKPLSGGYFTSGFGARWGRQHKGVDWACSVGTAIKASSRGVVSSAGWVSGYGNCITISHPDGKQTRYAHLSKILVSPGERVDQGEKIALSGNTGRSTGPHLHFEIIVGGSQVNPLKYLN